MSENTKLMPKRRFKEFQNADAWEQCELHKIADFSKGRGYSKNDLLQDGTPIILYGRLYTRYQVVISEVDTFVLANNGSVYSSGTEVIVPASGETAEDIARAAAVIKSGILLGGDLNIIYPNDVLDSVFLALEISNGNQQKELSKRAQGKSVVHLHNSDLKELAIFYPSKKEQIGISSFFATIDYLITLHQRKLEKTKSLKSAYLSEMFPIKGEREPKRRFAGFTDAWEQRKLGELCEEFQSGKYIKAEDIKEKGAFPVYGGNGFRGYSDTYNHDGIYALIGRQGALCGNMNISYGKAYFTEHAVAVRAKRCCDTKFLFYLFGTMNLGQYSGQSAQPGLAVSKLIELSGFVPRCDEQKRISEFFSNIDNLITLQQRRLEKLQNIKKAFLNEMFI